MTRKEKLLAAIKANGSGFTHRDATALLTYLGYRQEQGDGSRLRFVKPGRTPFLYHRPHNGKKELPTYVVDALRKLVKEETENVR